MTDEQYNKMVGMLITATEKEKLTWTELTNKFYVNVGGCGITLATAYFDDDTSGYTLSLTNSKGATFASYTVDEYTAPEQYKQLGKLYALVKDAIYQISKSEKSILDELKKLTGNE